MPGVKMCDFRAYPTGRPIPRGTEDRILRVLYLAPIYFAGTHHLGVGGKLRWESPRASIVPFPFTRGLYVTIRELLTYEVRDTWIGWSNPVGQPYWRETLPEKDWVTLKWTRWTTEKVKGRDV